MPEMRQDAVTGQWVIIATERAKRPEQPKIQKRKENLLEHKEDCFFCYGNEETTPSEVYAIRPDNSQPDTPGWLLRVVQNKYAALNLDKSFSAEIINKIEVKSHARGIAEVIIETQNHSLSPSEYSLAQFSRLLKTYKDRYIAIAGIEDIQYINIFRNHGALAGASLEHPHSQIIAIPVIPPSVEIEIKGSQAYHEKTGTCIYCDIIKQEIKDNKRIIFENSHFISYTPYASRTPYEIHISPKFHSSSFEKISNQQITLLAETFKQTLYKMDIGLEYPPYNYFIHTSPVNKDTSSFYHWHIEIIPNLTISAGFELCTDMFINVSIPEDCADYLRKIDVPL